MVPGVSAQLALAKGRAETKLRRPQMTTTCGRIPPGPAEKFDTTQDLLSWMGGQFLRYGDTYKASVYGTSVYATRNPKYAQHVLHENCRNYVKGQAIKRVELLLGNGLMVSEGEFWRTQRRMVQHAVHHSSTVTLSEIVTASNLALLSRWQEAAHNKVSVNVTRDVSGMVREVVLKSTFGADYEQVAPHFNILFEEPARNLAFARAFKSLEK